MISKCLFRFPPPHPHAQLLHSVMFAQTPGPIRLIYFQWFQYNEHSVCWAQLCLTLCNPMDFSPPSSSVHGVFQAAILELVAISFSRRSYQTRDRTCVSCIDTQILYTSTTWEAYFQYEMNESHSVVPKSLQGHRLYSPWNSPGQKTAVGSHSLLQQIFPTQGLNPGLPHWKQILYQLSHQGSPRILGWLAYPFSSGSSPPRNWTRVSCIAGGFFTSWATREVLSIHTFNIQLYLFTYLNSNYESLVAQLVKNLPAMQETWVSSLGHENPLEKRMATHSSILAWRIPRKRNLAATLHEVAESSMTEQLTHTQTAVTTMIYRRWGFNSKIINQRQKCFTF